MNRPPNDVRHPAAAAIQDIVMGKARAIEKTGMAEITYQIEIEAPDGMKVKDRGTIRRDPQEMPTLPASPIPDDIVDAVIEKLRGGDERSGKTKGQ